MSKLEGFLSIIRVGQKSDTIRFGRELAIYELKDISDEDFNEICEECEQLITLKYGMEIHTNAKVAAVADDDEDDVADIPKQRRAE